MSFMYLYSNRSWQGTITARVALHHCHSVGQQISKSLKAKPGAVHSKSYLTYWYKTEAAIEMYWSTFECQ